MDATKSATRPPPPNPAVPHREDCWSEGATAALIDAWGERFVELDRGHLRQKHWQEVADAVNSRRTAARRPSRSDVQCKNRVDTIKKKYKSERARITDVGGTSSWPFYDRLDSLIGDQQALVVAGAGPPSRKTSAVNSNANSTSILPEPPVAVPLPRRKGSPLPPPAAVASRPAESQSLLRKGIYSVAAAAAAAAAAREEDEVESGSSGGSSAEKGGGWREGEEEEGGGVGEGEAGGVRELARAILRFGEVYERVEAAKQKQMLELEKQRMEFVKGLEFQRMKTFVDSQIQLERVKRAKCNAGSSAASGMRYCILHALANPVHYDGYCYEKL